MFPKLKENATIGIVASSSPSTIPKINQAVKALEVLGYKVVLGKSVGETYNNYLSGTDDVRAKDITEMFRNKDINAIICLKGGYGSPRIIDKIDYEVIKNNPKVFSGFSDVTLLLNTIYMKTNLVTFHGPMLTVDFFNKRQKIHVDTFFKSLKNEKIIINDNQNKLKSINKGVTKGILVGGNLSLLQVFTAMNIKDYFKDKILFIEEVKEDNYRIDRMIQTLRLKGVFDNLKGIIIGAITGDTIPQTGSFELFKDLFKNYDYPIIFNAPIGHVTPRYTIPIGGKVKLDADNLIITIYNKQ